MDKNSEDNFPKSPGSEAYLELIKKKIEPKKAIKSNASSVLNSKNVKQVIGEEEFEDESPGNDKMKQPPQLAGHIP